MSRRFLTYEPWPAGLNNMRLNLEAAVVLAELTNRELVIPHDLYRDANEPEFVSGHFTRPLHPSHCFDLSSIECAMEHEIPDSATRVALPYLSPNHCLRTEYWDWVGGNVAAFSAGREILPWLAQYEDADVLHLPRTITPFYALFFAPPSSMQGIVRDSVRHKDRFFDSARHLAASIWPYHAIVVRRSEFLQQYPEASIMPSRILSELADNVPSRSTLLIATDEPDRSFFYLLEHAFERVVYARDLVSAYETGTTWEYSCIEQSLCALAETFVGTRLSTFSAYVDRLRGYYGTPDQRIRFTDGTHREIDDREGWPRYSWQPWLRRKQAIFGREFREGYL